MGVMAIGAFRMPTSEQSCTLDPVCTTPGHAVDDQCSGRAQTWSVPGRADLLENLVITSTAVNTVARVTVRARD